MPATLTVEELAEMQATTEENLPDVCNIVEISYTKDARGNETEVAVTGPDFACRIRPMAQSNQSAQEGLILQRLGVLEAWKIRAPKSIDAGVEDKILVEVAGTAARLMEIIASPGLKSRQLVDAYVAVEIK